MKKYILLLIFTTFLFSCGNGEKGLESTITQYFIKNNSDFTIQIKEYGGISKSATYLIEKDSLYSFRFVEGRGAFPYYTFIDSIRITFSDTFTVLSSYPNEMIKFSKLENCVIKTISDNECEVHYTITNEDYEYAKQKLAEREARNGGD